MDPSGSQRICRVRAYLCVCVWRGDTLNQSENNDIRMKHALGGGREREGEPKQQTKFLKINVSSFAAQMWHEIT